MISKRLRRSTCKQKHAGTQLIFAHYIMYLTFVKAFFLKSDKKAVKDIVTLLLPQHPAQCSPCHAQYHGSPEGIA